MEGTMKKKNAAPLAILAILAIMSTGTVMAASDRCVVVEADGNVLKLECRKDTNSFKPGMEVKIKTDSRAAIEGC